MVHYSHFSVRRTILLQSRYQNSLRTTQHTNTTKMWTLGDCCVYWNLIAAAGVETHAGAFHSSTILFQEYFFVIETMKALAPPALASVPFSHDQLSLLTSSTAAHFSFAPALNDRFIHVEMSSCCQIPILRYILNTTQLEFCGVQLFHTFHIAGNIMLPHGGTRHRMMGARKQKGRKATWRTEVDTGKGAHASFYQQGNIRFPTMNITNQRIFSFVLHVRLRDLLFCGSPLSLGSNVLLLFHHNVVGARGQLFLFNRICRGVVQDTLPKIQKKSRYLYIGKYGRCQSTLNDKAAC